MPVKLSAVKSFFLKFIFLLLIFWLWKVEGRILLTCGGTSRTISSRIMVSHTKQLRYRKGFAVRTWVSEKSCLKNCCKLISKKQKKRVNLIKHACHSMVWFKSPVKFVSCPHRARQETPPLVVLDAMTFLSPLIPPEWIAMQNDVKNAFSALKVPYQWRSCWRIVD